MTIAGNPKKIAYDIAQGYHHFTQSTLRQYDQEDLKGLLFNLNIVLRELRGKQIPLEDVEGLKDKNLKIRRLNQAISTLQGYSSQRGFKI